MRTTKVFFMSSEEPDNNSNNNYDIFISYRREGGADKARILKTELEKRGFKVFLDFDELKDGIFDQRIMHAIKSAPIFMILLSQNALDRCCEEEDWVRKEIEYAIKMERHIIPINPNLSFKNFPITTPPFIVKGVQQHQMSEIMFGQLFNASMDKMVAERIKPTLANYNRTEHTTHFYRRLLLISSIAIVLLAAITTILVVNTDNSAQEKITTAPIDDISNAQTSDEVQNESIEESVASDGITEVDVDTNDDTTRETLVKPTISEEQIKSEIESSFEYQLELFIQKYPQVTSYNMQAYQDDLLALDRTLTQLTNNIVAKYNPNNHNNLTWIKEYCDDVKSKQYTKLNEYITQTSIQEQNHNKIQYSFCEEVMQIYHKCFEENYYGIVASSYKDGMDKIFIEHKERAMNIAQPLIMNVINNYTERYPDMKSEFSLLAEEALKAILMEHNNNMETYRQHHPTNE